LNNVGGSKPQCPAGTKWMWAVACGPGEEWSYLWPHPKYKESADGGTPEFPYEQCTPYVGGLLISQLFSYCPRVGESAIISLWACSITIKISHHFHLHANNTSLASHVGKLRALEAVFIEHDTIQCQVRLLIENISAMMRPSRNWKGKTEGEGEGRSAEVLVCHTHICVIYPLLDPLFLNLWIHSIFELQIPIHYIRCLCFSQSHFHLFQSK
jgi:hypothetical protein